MDLLELAVDAELGIVWHDNPARYPYLRQTAYRCTTRNGAIGRGRTWSGGLRVVGYSVLRPGVSHQAGGLWVRRAFVSKMTDRDGTRVSPPAQEAVDPRRIRPRVLTPWLFYDHSPELCAQWLQARRAELGMADGVTVSSKPHLTPRQRLR